jgi:hypothetical protein
LTRWILFCATKDAQHSLRLRGEARGAADIRPVDASPLGGKYEQFVAYFQIVGPKAFAVTSVSATPFEFNNTLKISLPVFVDFEDSRAPSVRDYLAAKNNVRNLYLFLNSNIFVARHRWSTGASISNASKEHRNQQERGQPQIHGKWSFLCCAVILATGGRHNAVHSQVFHHLPVMIEAVADDQSGQFEPRKRTFAKGALDGFQQIAILMRMTL